ncbi:alpha/beta fold hydrolase [Rudaeicoccus suwonensis]|uniref:alpha/beta fold hydrolase n=1 Tax=Rudaeicoccus suwonensis TaxID=657409 RepID=UPI001476B1E0|nr:alpha/beta hydrolase [Rudaeicoccus suwonensis]
MIEPSWWHTLSRPDGTEISYVAVGSGDQTVLLLHGLAGCAEEWGQTIDGLRGRCRVVAPDQRGHGRSTRIPSDVSSRSYVEDAAAVIRAVSDRPVTVIGHSMGGHTALLLAAEHPQLVDRLMLVESGVGGGGDAATAPTATRLRRWPTVFVDREEFYEFFGGPPAVARVWADGLNVRVDGLHPRWDAATLVSALTHVHLMPRWRAWDSITAPTTLVHADAGTVAATEIAEMVTRRPEVRTEQIVGAGHDVHLEQPEKWLEVVGRFLQD